MTRLSGDFLANDSAAARAFGGYVRRLLAGLSIALAPLAVAKADTPHIYVSVAAVTLPDPGHPLVEIFADAGGAKRSGEQASIEVIYALGAPQRLHDEETRFISFQYTANCAAKTLQLTNYDMHRPDGSVSHHPSSDAPTLATKGIGEIVLALACGKGSGARGYADLDHVLADAAAYTKSQVETDASVKHSFVLTGVSAKTSAGPVRLYVDTATLARSGAEVTAYTLEVFQKPVGPQIEPGAYTLSAMTIDCSARTATTTYSLLYKPNGERLEGGLAINAEPRSVKPNTLQDKMFKLICNSEDPGHKSVQPTLAAAVSDEGPRP